MQITFKDWKVTYVYYNRRCKISGTTDRSKNCKKHRKSKRYHTNANAIWSRRSKHIIEGRKWFYNSIKEWSNQMLYYSESTIKRAIRFLEKRGLIISRKISAKKFNQTKWYSITEEEVLSFLREVHSSDNNISESKIISLSSNKKTKNKLFDNDLGQNDQIDLVLLTQSFTKTNISSSKKTEKIENLKNAKQEDFYLKNEEKNKISNNLRSKISQNVILEQKIELSKDGFDNTYSSERQKTSLQIKKDYKNTSLKNLILARTEKLTYEESEQVIAMKDAWNVCTGIV